MRILFSPLGMTDPIAQNHDGAMLHICRYYAIDKVYFYMSKEICELEDERQYEKTIEKLSAVLGRKIEVAETIRRPELSEVQIFDVFIDDFREILGKIRRENPNAELYLNVSSGTPAMKSALHVLAALSENGNMIPIQVSTPARASNSHRVYEAEKEWENNKDNEPGAENRTAESGHINFLNEIKKKMLRSLIDKFDYVGALILAEEMEDILTDKFMRMLDGAAKRITFSYGDALNEFDGEDIIPNHLYPASSLYRIEEYLRMLEVKEWKEEFGDFIRGITPLITELFEIILHDLLGFNVEDFVYRNAQGERCWNRRLLSRSDIWEDLKREFDGDFNGNNILSIHLLKIIKIKCSSTGPQLYRSCETLRTVEENIRNRAAHRIIYLSAENIQAETGMSPDDIVETLRKVLSYVDESADSEDFFRSYDKMNEVLLNELYRTAD